MNLKSGEYKGGFADLWQNEALESIKAQL